jgi:hypothetical protein
VALDCLGRELRRIAAGAAHHGTGPERSWVRIEAEHQPTTALADERREPVREVDGRGAP